jgi:GntR family transcriptional regulator
MSSRSILSRNVPQPLYHQLKTVLLREIEAGHWKADQQLPTESEFAERFEVSKITVRQALRELAEQGHVRREQGRGTFVQPARLQQGPRELTSFTTEMRRHGLVSASTVLSSGPEPASPEVATALGLEHDTLVFRLHRLRLADGEPMGVQTTYLPMALVPGIEAIEFADVSLYDVLQDRYSLHPTTARETFCVALVGDDDAPLLRVPVGSPAMVAERVTYLADSRPFEYVQSVMRGDRYKIVVDLTVHGSR